MKIKRNFCHFQLHFNKCHPDVTLEDYYNKVIKATANDVGEAHKAPPVAAAVAVKRERTESNASELSSGYDAFICGFPTKVARWQI